MSQKNFKKFKKFAPEFKEKPKRPKTDFKEKKNWREFLTENEENS